MGRQSHQSPPCQTRSSRQKNESPPCQTRYGCQTCLTRQTIQRQTHDKPPCHRQKGQDDQEIHQGRRCSLLHLRRCCPCRHHEAGHRRQCSCLNCLSISKVRNTSMRRSHTLSQSTPISLILLIILDS